MSEMSLFESQVEGHLFRFVEEVMKFRLLYERSLRPTISLEESPPPGATGGPRKEDIQDPLGLRITHMKEPPPYKEEDPPLKIPMVSMHIHRYEMLVAAGECMELLYKENYEDGLRVLFPRGSPTLQNAFLKADTKRKQAKAKLAALERKNSADG